VSLYEKNQYGGFHIGRMIGQTLELLCHMTTELSEQTLIQTKKIIIECASIDDAVV